MTKVEKYPKDFQEFLAQFKCEDDCWDYIFNMRWLDGFICLKCDCKQYGMTKQRLIHCTSCGHQTSITGGTIFHGTRKPLLLWFHIMWWVVAQKTGRWINGTHQGNVSPKHLPHYLDEYAFRFNRRLSTYRGKLFYRLVQQTVDTPPIPFNEISKST